jgi:hypothetical protein
VDDKAETGVDSDESRETALVPPQHTDFASETVKVRVAQIKSFFGDRFAEPFHSVAQVTESNSTDSTPVSSSLANLHVPLTLEGRLRVKSHAKIPRKQLQLLRPRPAP